MTDIETPRGGLPDSFRVIVDDMSEQEGIWKYDFLSQALGMAMFCGNMLLENNEIGVETHVILCWGDGDTRVKPIDEFFAKTTPQQEADSLSTQLFDEWDYYGVDLIHQAENDGEVCAFKLGMTIDQFMQFAINLRAELSQIKKINGTLALTGGLDQTTLEIDF